MYNASDARFLNYGESTTVVGVSTNDEYALPGLEELKRRKQWVCYKLHEKKDGKFDKKPCDPVRAYNISWTNPDNWLTFENAKKYAEANSKIYGIGFVLTDEDPYAILDIDDCIDSQTGEIEVWAKELVEEYGSYTEITPSDKGLRIWIKGEVLGTKEPEVAGTKIEVYSEKRFATVTGRHLEGTPEQIYWRQPQLLTLSPPRSPKLKYESIDLSVTTFPSGERNNGMFRGLCKHRSLNKSFEEAVEWAKRVARDSDPPFDESEAEAIAVRVYETYPPGEDERADGAARQNQADRLVKLAQENLDELFLDQYDKPHALVDGECIPLNRRAHPWLTKLLWDSEGRTANSEALTNATRALGALAKYLGNQQDLHVRSAQYEGKLYYELWPGCVVEVGSGFWCTVQDPPVRFRRVPNLKPLPAPSGAASAPSSAALMVQQDVDRIGKNTNSTINTNICALSSEYVKLKHERDKRLFVAYLVTALLPHVARPILQFTGVMGSGKSTASRFVKRAVDPSAPETIRLDKPSEVLQKASHAHVLMIDNARGIPDWAEDMLCRLVTGEADSKRQLYTDDDDIIYELMRVVLLNGINVPSERGDVQDRTLPIELDRIPDQERTPEEDMWRRFGEVHPQLLSAIFDVLGAALAVYPSISMSRTPRLADWGRYAAAVYEVLGWGTTQFLEDWRKVVESQTTAAVEGSPVAQAVVKYMEDRDHYRDTAANLLPELEEAAEEVGIDTHKDNAWPQSARWLWRRLKVVVPLLADWGIEVTYHPTRGSNEIELRRCCVNDGADGADGAAGSSKPNSRHQQPESNGASPESNGAGDDLSDATTSMDEVKQAEYDQLCRESQERIAKDLRLKESPAYPAIGEPRGYFEPAGGRVELAFETTVMDYCGRCRKESDLQILLRRSLSLCVWEASEVCSCGAEYYQSLETNAPVYDGQDCLKRIGTDERGLALIETYDELTKYLENLEKYYDVLWWRVIPFETYLKATPDFWRAVKAYQEYELNPDEEPALYRAVEAYLKASKSLEEAV